MKKFRVPFTFTCTVTVEVEAENKEEAIDQAYNEVGVRSYVGNGGYDKLIGVSNSNHSIEAGDGFEVEEDEVEEIA